MQIDELSSWFREHHISSVECLVPDMAGMTRGKSTTPRLFIEGLDNKSLRIPEAIYTISAQGETIFSDFVKSTERDLVLVPDLSTLHISPWNNNPTACFICDSLYDDGTPNELAPRQILKNILNLYEKKGWTPIVGPEVEFYLIEKFKDIILEPRPPNGRSGLRECGQEVYSLDALDEFAPIFEDLYKFSDIQNIDLETLIHEDGPCQFEVNLGHNNALNIADQLYLFKRLARHTVKRHNMFITFMAKPYAKQSGSSIHLHQSVIDTKTKNNIFSNQDGTDSQLFMNYIGGLQTYLPIIMPLLAPYANSYHRFKAFMCAPTNTSWGRENRTVGLRVPSSKASARRVENRIAGSDTNPYLALAASLLCGYIGMIDEIEPRAEFIGESYTSSDHALPSQLTKALENFTTSKEMRHYLGDHFVDTFAKIKNAENEHRSTLLNPWDVRFLMVNI